MRTHLHAYRCGCGSSVTSRSGGRNREVEGRTMVYCALRPNAYAVAINNPVYRGEPDPRSREFRLRVQALEWAEELFGILHVKTRSVVTNEERSDSFLPVGPDLDPRRRDLRRKLPGVPEQVVERHAHEPVVCLHQQLVFDTPFDVPIAVLLVQPLRDTPGDVGEINLIATEIGTANPGEEQEVVDQFAHALRRRTH